MDAQVVEVLGRHLLVDQLLRAGVEVAQPIRDRGVDLIAYRERGADHLRFQAFPIQLKACSDRVDVPGLIIAHIWYVARPTDAVIYAMYYDQALAIAEAMKYAASSSWRDGGYYATTSPAARLVELLGEYRMTPQRWRDLVGDERRGAR
jgi:hypothetical protein